MYSKSTVTSIYRQRQQFTVFNNAQQCGTFRAIRPSSGIKGHGLKNSENALNTCWDSRNLVNFTIIVNILILGYGNCKNLRNLANSKIFLMHLTFFTILQLILTSEIRLW